MLLDIIEPLKTDFQKEFILSSKQDAGIHSDVSYVKDEEALVSDSKLAVDDPSCSENKIVDFAPHDGNASKTDGKLVAVAKDEPKDYEDEDNFVVKRNLSHWKEKTKAIHNFAKAKILPIFAEEEVRNHKGSRNSNERTSQIIVTLISIFEPCRPFVVE